MKQNFTIDELELILGEHIRQIRLQRNIDRKTLAERAGVSLNALKNLEGGKGATIKTLMHAIRSLDKEEWIQSLAPSVTINPLHMVKDKPVRLRASGKRGSSGAKKE